MLKIDSNVTTAEGTIKIANFNAQVWGKSKLEKIGVDWYVDFFDDYDIGILQEIRESSGESFETLCDRLENEYDCLISSRAGQSSSKEQVGIIYKKVFQASLQDFTDTYQNEAQYEEYVSYGIIEIPKEVSDHKAIYVEVGYEEV